MQLTLLTGSAHASLAGAVAERLGLAPGDCEVQRFPDGELHVRILDSVRGHDVYLVQPTSPPVQEHLMELLLLADAALRAGAARVTAVIPYFAYARQDRRATGREPLSARLVADLLVAGGVRRVVAVDLHSLSLEGFFGVPLEHLSAVPLLAEAVRPWAGEQSVLVAPDLGAARLVDRYAHLLNLPVAIVHKARLSGEAVEAQGITGEVRDRAPIVVDDMISTGATTEAAINALLAAGSRPEVTVVATHPLLVGTAADRLRALPVRRCIVSDSVPGAAGHLLPIEVVSLAPLLAEAIDRLHHDRSLGDLIVHR